MNFPKLSIFGTAFHIAYRYIRPKKGIQRQNRFISFISGLSITGIALGVASLIIVLSVMNGFQKEVRDKMLGVVSHVEVNSFRYSASEWQYFSSQLLDIKQKADAHLKNDKKHPFPYPKFEDVKENIPVEIHERLKNQFKLTQAQIEVLSHIQAVSPYQEQPAIVSDNQGNIQPILLRGIVPSEESKTSRLKFQIGSWESLNQDPFSIAIGKDLAKEWHLKIGDGITVFLADAAFTPMGVIPRYKNFTIGAIFDAQHAEYNKSLMYIPYDTSLKFFQNSMPSANIHLKLDDLFLAPQVSEAIDRLHLDAGTRDWTKINSGWFAAVQTEKRMMFIILTLIIAIAAFNLVSMLIMTVLEKKGEIAILRTMGMPKKAIMSIFIIQGTLIGLIGTFIGLILGTTVALNLENWVDWVEKTFNVALVPKEVYFIDRLPSDWHTQDAILITIVSISLSFIATLYPSYAAMKIQPAQALKKE